jgi:hypothetical protein
MQNFLSFFHRYRTRRNYLWVSAFGVGWCWGCASHLRDYLSADGANVSQFIATNWAYTLLTVFCVFLWPIATWQRAYCIGASELGATAYTAGLALLWGVTFCFHIPFYLSLALFLIVPLPLAISKGNLSRGISEPMDPSEHSQEAH